MSRLVLVILLSVVSVGVVASQPQFKASTSLVRLEVSVTDDRGTVLGLGAEDFVVDDRGARQAVQVDASVDTPLDLVLVVQPLTAVAYTSPEQAARLAPGVSSFFQHVEERDRLGVLVGGAPPTLVRALAFGPPSSSLESFVGSEYAAPFDAIASALREFPPSDRRRALVAFTNAADFRSVIDFDTLADMARRLGPAFVLVSAPILVQDTFGSRAEGPGGRSAVPMEASVSGHVFPAQLRLLASRTGGITVNLGDGDPEVLIKEMFMWLRTRYVVSYTPPPGNGWHPVSLKVNRRGATVTTREGYFVD